MQVILQTPRLLLRRMTIADAPSILELNSDPEVLKYLHEPALQSIAAAEKIITDIIFPQYKNNLGRWAVHTKHDNTFIGWCGLKFRPFLDEIDLGYRFMKNSWGKGYATEAAKHTLDFGFQKLQINTITGRAHIENAASINVLEKIGMQFIKEELVDECPVRTYTKANPSV